MVLDIVFGELKVTYLCSILHAICNYQGGSRGELGLQNWLLSPFQKVDDNNNPSITFRLREIPGPEGTGPVVIWRHFCPIIKETLVVENA